jgi:hypothetical protein
MTSRIPRIGSFLLFSALAACAGMDRDAGQALGTAGQTASQALVDQADATRTTIDALPEWWVVHDTLVCAMTRSGPLRAACLNNVAAGTSPALSSAQKDLSTIMQKRATAAGALRDAYQSFVNLATYDAGTETEKALRGAFGAVNDLAIAVGTAAPGAALITSAFSSTASGVASLLASQRLAELMLSASRDLHKATDAMSGALTAEADRLATTSLLTTLGAEKDSLYASFVQSGLIAPRDALMPLLTQIAPGAQMAATLPKDKSDVIEAAAVASLAERSRRQQAAIAASYDACLAALKALSAQHARLEAAQPIELSQVLALAKRIEAIIVDAKSGK